MLVDYEFYINEFLFGDTPLIPEHSFPRLAQRAWEHINFKNIEISPEITYDILVDNNGYILTDITDKILAVKGNSKYFKNILFCICAVAEILFEQGNVPKAGQIISGSNDTESWKISEIKDFTLFESRIQTEIFKYLWNTKYWNSFGYIGAR